MTKVARALSNILSLRKEYYQLAVGQDALLKLISETEIPEAVYNSNAIENSTLTLEETEKILLQIDLDRYISERELFEAKNLARVVGYIEHKSREVELSPNLILRLHQMLLSNIRDDVAGRFRTGNEFVRVGSHIAPAPELVAPQISQMIQNYLGSHDNIISRLSLLHLTFEHIHPFVDGNGRIGRALLNFLLIREGYVPINIKFNDRKLYYEGFKEFDASGATGITELIVARAITNSYHKRLAYLKHQEIISLSEYAKKFKLSHSNLLNKAVRQSIPSFLEKNAWKIGI